MIRVGIAGLGFMGKMHFRCYKNNADVQIVAVCDIEQENLKETAGTAGNVAGAEEALDFTGVELYTDFDKMLAETELDAVSICAPTYLHKELTVKALEAGLNVLCEKPMALDEASCMEMILAQEKSGKRLQVGHCIRFWPEYAKSKEIVDSGKYGSVKIATFQRLSMTPVWAWKNWFMDGSKSGGAALDLHIHDADFVQYLFGMPESVDAHGIKGPTGDFDHVVASYKYDDDKLITAEGGWMMAPAFGFRMNFHIVFEKATITYDSSRDPAFTVCPVEGEAFTPEVESGDGYSLEIVDFVKAVSGQDVPEVTTPEQSLNSIKIILAEKESIRSGKVIELN